MSRGSRIELEIFRGTNERWKCRTVRKHTTLCEQKLKLRCARKFNAAAVCAKLKEKCKLVVIFL
jgi:hypothetical protein